MYDAEATDREIQRLNAELAEELPRLATRRDVQDATETLRDVDGDKVTQRNATETLRDGDDSVSRRDGDKAKTRRDGGRTKRRRDGAVIDAHKDDEGLASVGIILGAKDDWDKIESPGLNKDRIVMTSKTRKVGLYVYVYVYVCVCVYVSLCGCVCVYVCVCACA